MHAVVCGKAVLAKPQSDNICIFFCKQCFVLFLVLVRSPREPRTEVANSSMTVPHLIFDIHFDDTQ